MRNVPRGAESKRAETMAFAGMALHLIIGVVLFALCFQSDALIYPYLTMQTIVGVAFFFASFLHLRLRRLAVNEELELEETERKRKAKGMGTLFAEDEMGAAARNLLHMGRYISPALSIIYSLFLLAPALFLIYMVSQSGVGFGEYLFADMPLKLPLYLGFLPLIFAFLLFVLGVYSSGLCRITEWRPLRAGAGYALSSALFLALAGGSILLGAKISFYPERVLLVILVIVTTLQAFEVFANVILDHYRPRLPDIEQRPAYDSRLTGLLAEPQGFFKTFAHTLDYQFGFKVSDTWFFHFIEKAFAPLVFITLLSLYLLSCFVVVAPGQSAIIERFGAPRGTNPTQATTDWDMFALKNPPLSEGVHIKYPWPFEKAKSFNQARLNKITLGLDQNKAKENQKSVMEKDFKAWDAEDVKGEVHYLMPNPGKDNSGKLDILFLAGLFSFEYTIGDNGNLYRYAYNYSNSEEMFKAIAESVLLEFLAGADFWTLLARQTDTMRGDLFDRIEKSIKEKKLGIKLTSITISNLHPPTGEVGKAFLNVISSRQQKQLEINIGKITAQQIIGLAPSEADKVLKEAQAYKTRRATVAEAEAAWFNDQMKAYSAAPAVYPILRQMQMLENGLENASKVLLPENATMIMDDSKATDPESIYNTLAREINKLER